MWSGIPANLSKNLVGWTLLISRNGRNEKLIRDAASKSYLTVKDGASLLGEVIEKARKKFRRAQENFLKLI